MNNLKLYKTLIAKIYILRENNNLCGNTNFKQV